MVTLTTAAGTKVTAWPDGRYIGFFTVAAISPSGALCERHEKVKAENAEEAARAVARVVR